MQFMDFPRAWVRSMQSQRGASMVEFAICAPFLVVLLVATIEFGRYSSQYQLLSQVTVDALNLPSKVHDLEPNIICQTDGNPALPNPPLGCSTATHHLVGHDRANIIAALQSPWVDLSETNLRMESFYNPTLQTVRFRVYSEFVPLFAAFFDHVPFEITLTGPYLPGTGIGTGVGIPKLTLDLFTGGGYVFDMGDPNITPIVIIKGGTLDDRI